MGRLIDVDAVGGTFALNENYTGREVIALLNQQPTAYDLDKVVEQLEKEVALENDWDDEMSCGARNAYSHAINIVKAGGKG